MLLAPAETPPTLGRSVVIAWNGSTELARTIAFGMPFLVAAKRIEVLTVEGHRRSGPAAATCRPPRPTWYFGNQPNSNRPLWAAFLR